MKQITTLCLVNHNSMLLLGIKKRGFGAGKYNGFGGKVNPGESIEEAAHRELFEECGIIEKGLEQKGLLNFKFEDGTNEIEMHIFEVTKFEGEPVETEEMKPQWFYHNELPYDKMWADDRFWVPIFLEGKKFEGEILFKDQTHILDYKLTEKES